MTQTNNERELFETDDGKWDGVIRAFWRRIQGYQKCEFNDIKDLPDPLPVEFRAHFATALLNAPKELRTPISQNEQQEGFNLEQILHDPENQPSQYGTVPLEWYENLETQLQNWKDFCKKIQASQPKQIPDEWVADPDTIPSQLIEITRQAICLEFGDSGTDGYYKRILAKIFKAMLNASPTTSLTSETNTEVGND